MRLSLRLLLVLALFGAALSHAAKDEFARLLRAGIHEADQSNFSAAVGDIEAAINLDPSNPDGWYQLGLLRGQMADFRGAELPFRKAIELKPDFAQAHYSLGVTLRADPQSKLDWPGAISEFREALKYRPDYPEALNLLGSGLTNTGNADAAIPELQRAIELKPALSEAHFNLGIALEQKDRLEGAAKEYKQAVATRNDYPDAISALGKLLFRMGKTEEAEHEMETALRLNPDLLDAHYTLARVLQKLGQQGEATIEFDEARDLSQRGPDAVQSSVLSNSALELASRGDLHGAAASLRTAITLKPDYGVPHYNLGLILADMGDLSGAVQELIKATSLLPGQAKPWFDLGRVWKRQRDNTRALTAVAWAARLAPSDAGIRSELASLRSSDSTRSGANPLTLSLRQPTIGAPSDTMADHVAFAAELSTRGDYQGAVGELLRSLVLQPDAIKPRYLLALSYEKVGNDGRALLEYHKIIRVEPKYAATHVSMGKLLLKRGDSGQAAREFRIALALQPRNNEARSALHQALRDPSRR